MPDPAPTDMEIAQSTLPVGINHCTQAQGNHSRTRAKQIKSRCSQNQTQARESIGVTNFTRLQLKTSRFICQEIFFQVKSQAIFVKGMQIGWIATENSPIFIAIAGLYMRQAR